MIVVSAITSMGCAIGPCVATVLKNHISRNANAIIVIFVFLFVSYMLVFLCPYYFFAYNILKKVH